MGAAFYSPTCTQTPVSSPIRSSLLINDHIYCYGRTAKLEHTYHTYYIFGIIRTYFNVWYFIIRVWSSPGGQLWRAVASTDSQPAIVIICAISVYCLQALSIAVLPLPCREAILTFWNTVCESAVTSSSGLPVRLWLLYSFQPNRLSRVTTTASSMCFFINVGQQSYLLLFGIPSPTHSFIPGLKPSFFANPSHRSPSFSSSGLTTWIPQTV